MDDKILIILRKKLITVKRRNILSISILEPIIEQSAKVKDFYCQHTSCMDTFHLIWHTLFSENSVLLCCWKQQRVRILHIYNLH